MRSKLTTHTPKAANDNSFFALSKAGFNTWLSQSEKGSVQEYYRGFLAKDASTTTSELSTERLKEAVQIALLIRKAYGDGLILLTQKRLGHECFSYRAIKTHECRPANDLNNLPIITDIARRPRKFKLTTVGMKSCVITAASSITFGSRGSRQSGFARHAAA